MHAFLASSLRCIVHWRPIFVIPFLTYFHIPSCCRPQVKFRSAETKAELKEVLDDVMLDMHNLSSDLNYQSSISVVAGRTVFS